MITFNDWPPHADDDPDKDCMLYKYDADGSYLVPRLHDHGRRSITVIGIMQGTPGEYSRAASRILGQRLYVEKTYHMLFDNLTPEEAQKQAERGWCVIALAPWRCGKRPSHVPELPVLP